MEQIEKLITKYNKEFKVASLRDKTLNLLVDIIKENNINHILEIGTGVGYSAYSINKKISNLQIDSIEKSSERYNIAKKLLYDFKNINLYNIDCFEFKTCKKYDLIIIDGPKRNQIELFNYLQSFSLDNTIFFIDNIKLEKIRNIKEKNNNQIKIIESVDEFNAFLVNNKEIKFKYYDIDDGVMVGCKKWN